MNSKTETFYFLLSITLVLVVGGMVGVMTGVAASYSYVCALFAFITFGLTTACISYGVCRYLGGSLTIFGHRRFVSLGWFDDQRPYLIRRAWSHVLALEALGAVMGYALINICR